MTMPSSSNTTKNSSQVPPGFRFHPTDEELVNYYLRKKVNMEKFDLDVIRDVDLNKLEPWDLHERCKIDSSQQVEWYFFSHKDKKYPTGSRTNRATMAGFWKATGRDKAVYHCSERIGMRKTLVFYRGRAPHGQKTDWIMHEYRLEDPSDSNSSSPRNNEDGWVVCRVFKKRIHNFHTSNTKSNNDFTNSYNAFDEDQTNLEDNANQGFYDKGGDGVTREHQTAIGFACKEEVNMYSNDEEESDHNADNVGPSLHLPQVQTQKDVEGATINMSINNDSSSLLSQGHRQSYDRTYTRLMNRQCHESTDMISPSNNDKITNQACCSPNVSFNIQEPTMITTSSTCSSTMTNTSTCSSSTNNNLFFPYENDNLMNNLYFEDYISTQDQWAHIGLEVGLSKDLRLYHHVDSTSDLGLISINTAFCTPDFPP